MKSQPVNKATNEGECCEQIQKLEKEIYCFKDELQNFQDNLIELKNIRPKNRNKILFRSRYYQFTK